MRVFQKLSFLAKPQEQTNTTTLRYPWIQKQTNDSTKLLFRLTHTTILHLHYLLVIPPALLSITTRAVTPPNRSNITNKATAVTHLSSIKLNNSKAMAATHRNYHRTTETKS